VEEGKRREEGKDVFFISFLKWQGKRRRRKKRKNRGMKAIF